jgi:hypothetical protein
MSDPMSLATDMFQNLQKFRTRTGITHHNLVLVISQEKWDRLKHELERPPTLGKWTTGTLSNPELFGLKVIIDLLLRGDQHVWIDETKFLKRDIFEATYEEDE